MWQSLIWYWQQSCRMLWRDWRGGELRLLAVGLIIAVTSISAVGFFTDRIERGLVQSSAELLAADLVLSSRNDNVLEHLQEARQAGFDTATTRTFSSVLLANGKPQLVEVKAVSENYPLRGTVRTSATAYATDSATDEVPVAGRVWVEPRLLQLLSLKVGDEISLGQSALRIDRVIRFEPDRAGDMFGMSPRVMMNQADVDATGLIGLGSRVTYRVLVAGERSSIELFSEAISSRLANGERILTLEDGRPELNTALQSARQFLGLAALISVLLAGVAIATVSNRYARRHLVTSAMMSSLGMSQPRIITLFVSEMLLLSIIASSIGVLAGGLTQTVIANMLDQLVLTSLPPPSLAAVTMGYATGILLITGFAIPPLMSLKNVPPVRVLRHDVPVPPVSNSLLYLAIFVCMTLLLFWQIGDIKLVAYVIGGMTLTFLLLAAAALGMIRLLGRSRSSVGVAWRFGLANIVRRPISSILQVVAFGVGIMVLLLLSTVRGDLINNWERSLPPDAPNHFLINIQDDQVEGMLQMLTDMRVNEPQLYPMIRTRLTQINNEDVDVDDYDNEQARRMLTREFNLSWSENMQIDNVLIEGEWWTEEEHGEPLMSLEEGIAVDLGLAIGDLMTFDINGVETGFRVSNLRTVSWDSFNINFFTVVPPGVLDGVPASWITSVYLDEQQRQQIGPLVEAFPNVTVIDTAIIMQRVRSIIDKVSTAVEFIFLFTLLAGLAVLYAAIQANQDQRRFEGAVLRTLGADRRTLWTGLLAEFSMLGALSGSLAGASATVLTWVLAERVFQFDYTPDPMVALTGLLAGVAIVCIAGMLGTRSVVSTPPVTTLRERPADGA